MENPTATVLWQRGIRLQVIQDQLDAERITKEEALELLALPLSPGKGDPIDDSQLLIVRQ